MATLQLMDMDIMETPVSGVRLHVDLERIRATAAGWVFWNRLLHSILSMN